MKEEEQPLWVYPDYSPEWCDSIVKEFNIHPVTAQVLVSRGFSTFEEIYNYLYAKLPNLIAPDQFQDMNIAVERIVQAVTKKETIIVYGDNDVDGITGTTLLVEFLRKIGGHTLYYVPNRTTSSPTMITDALQFALESKCKLFITVDCGITAADEIDEYFRNHIDVIISDHHEPTAKIPNCIATLNPKLINSTYPNRDLTGVGVAFKLAHALTNHLVSTGKISPNKIDLKRFLDLVALGTIADMGALIGENRILVRYGLRQFAQTKRIGLLKLMEICEVKASTITTADIASKIAPRLNSLGRIADPQKGVELLLMHDSETATTLAKELDDNNTERQRIERRDSDDIEHYLLDHPQALKNNAIVLHSDKWHPGIIPIIAARVSKQYNRPTLIIAVDQGIGKGSIRTIPEFPLLSSLRKHRNLLVNFGGHDYAAGLIILEENIVKFKNVFIEMANQALNQEDIIPKLHLDARVQFEDLTFDFLDSLQLLEPYGTANPPPILYSDVTQAWPPKIVGKTHLKLYLEQNERILEGIGFGLSEARSRLCKKNLKLQIAFTPHVNVFLNKSSIQLLIKDFKIKD
ncbi:single-stranded-DNA-specific exonuclease RecJ [Simkania negevensis]|uniref:Single-stranded-DNA-specific exonuclease RecJ n=1 Tax=Simkania negevensis (strain ATCC VR-1471 / DSM 27360 / Z) TaxID=331113 RepID=F8L432_SIMNZ|nr:single-stranded-DNA-specific exonuclease RecJ [Simkania negevensis]CCB90063.1 single-stranded-DNA-specific exonuclease recJ [Simkania negevensis Z]